MSLSQDTRLGFHTHGKGTHLLHTQPHYFPECNMPRLSLMSRVVRTDRPSHMVLQPATSHQAFSSRRERVCCHHSHALLSPCLHACYTHPHAQAINRHPSFQLTACSIPAHPHYSTTLTITCYPEAPYTPSFRSAAKRRHQRITSLRLFRLSLAHIAAFTHHITATFTGTEFMSRLNNVYSVVASSVFVAPLSPGTWKRCSTVHQQFIGTI